MSYKYEPLTVEMLEELVEKGEVETVIAAFPDMYGRLLGKRLTGHFFLSDVADGFIHACDYLLTSDIDMEPVQGYRFSSWGTGYGDIRLVPDLSTLRLATWLPKTALVLCDVYYDGEDRMVEFAPRTILKQQIQRAKERGYTAMGATELEMYLFKDSYEEAARKNYQNLEPIGGYIEDYHIFQGTKEEHIIGALRHHMDRSGVPIESSKGEAGPGQQEVNWRFSDLLEAADRHTIFKHAAKEIAWQNGCSITFMAKWDERYCGSSMHVHVSLWDEKGEKPLFPGSEPVGPLQASPIFRWFLGGWLAYTRDIFAFYAPYPTSYKRYVDASFAPTAIAWSYDNRTAGYRVCGRGPSLRIEGRAPGADANPYLSLAVSLAAGLAGIEKRIEPPEPISGDMYAAKDLPQVPKSLKEAMRALDESAWARETLGDAVVDHYLHFMGTEQRKFDFVVTSWERARYFERV